MNNCDRCGNPKKVLFTSWYCDCPENVIKDPHDGTWIGSYTLGTNLVRPTIAGGGNITIPNLTNGSWVVTKVGTELGRTGKCDMTLEFWKQLPAYEQNALLSTYRCDIDFSADIITFTGFI